MRAALSPQAAQTLATLPALRAFGEEDRDRLTALFREECHPKGAVLFHEGDVARTVYLIVSGEVRVTSGGSPVAHLGPGELFGEMALLTGERRSASVEVTLDCRLLVLDAEPFLRLLADHPAVYEQFVGLLSRRLSRANSPARARRGYEVVFVDDRSRWPDAPAFVAMLAASVERELGRPVAILTLAGSGSAGAGPGDGGRELVLRVDHRHPTAAREALATRLAELRERVALVLVVPEARLAESSAELTSLADTVLVLTDDPLPGGPPPPPVRRIAVYDRRRGPAPAWSDTSVAILPRLARRRQAAVDRLARCLAHRTVGLALGSGVAYGLAHIGVLAVLDEAGVPVDLVAGASMGAVVGAGYALGMSPEEMMAAALRFGALPTLVPMLPRLIGLGLDVSLRRPGIFTGERFKSFLASFCPVRDAAFSDLRLPFRAVATDIDTGARVDLAEGRLADALRASVSAPWLFTPQRLGDRVLVDGGMSDPVPSDTARSMGADIVIAVNVVPPLDPRLANPLERLLRAADWINPFAYLDGERRLQGSFDVVMKCLLIMQHELGNARSGEADVLINPALAGFWFLEFWSARALIERGVEATRAALPAIRKRLGAPPVGGASRPSHAEAAGQE